MASTADNVERGIWSIEEHDKFLEALKQYPQGPWKAIAQHIGTRSARQVQTHAQKYYEKVARRLRGLRKSRKNLVRPEHRLDDNMVDLCHQAVDDSDRLHGFVDPIEIKRLVRTSTRMDHQQNNDRDHQDQGRVYIESPIDSGNISDTESKADSDDGSEGIDLSSIDQECLDYLLQILESSDCNSDSGRSSC